VHILNCQYLIRKFTKSLLVTNLTIDLNVIETDFKLKQPTVK